MTETQTILETIYAANQALANQPAIKPVYTRKICTHCGKEKSSVSFPKAGAQVCRLCRRKESTARSRLCRGRKKNAYSDQL